MNRPEFVPPHGGNDNDFNQYFNGNPYPLRNPPPPPGMVKLGLHHTIPIFSVNRPQMFPPGYEQPNRVVLMVPMQRPAQAFGRPFSPNHPPVPPMMPQQERVFEDHAENVFQDEAAPMSIGTPVNFALCRERFNGFGDVRPFINAILDFKNCSEMRDDSALRSLPLLLTGQAAYWWQAHKVLVTDWNSAIKLLRQRFRVRPEQHRILRRLFSTPQNEESTAAYVHKVKGLLSKIPINTLTQETQLDIVYALLHRRIRDKVKRDECDNFIDLLERAREVEEAIVAAKSQAPASPVPLEAPVKPSTSDEPSSSKAVLKSDESDNAETPPSTCDNCKINAKLFERTCRKLHRGEKTAHNVLLLEELSKLDAEKFSKMVCFRCRSDPVEGLQCQTCPHGALGNYGLITVGIYEKDFNIVVDTGSSYTIASEDLIAYLVANGQEFALTVLILPIKNIPTRQVLRVATVEMMLAGVKIMTEFVEVPGATKSVFGMNFIQKTGMVFDFRGAGTWTVRGASEEHPIIFERVCRQKTNN